MAQRALEESSTYIVLLHTHAYEHTHTHVCKSGRETEKEADRQKQDGNNVLHEWLCNG